MNRPIRTAPADRSTVLLAAGSDTSGKQASGGISTTDAVAGATGWLLTSILWFWSRQVNRHYA